MTDDNEALRKWLWAAWDASEAFERIVHKAESGMPLADAWREIGELLGESIVPVVYKTVKEVNDGDVGTQPARTNVG